MRETERLTVGRALPKIADVAAVSPTSVAVTWEPGSRDGRSEIVDLAPMLHAFRMYRPLRDDPEAFARVRVAAFGSAIAWDDDEQIDMSAVAVEELAEQGMDAADLKAFMKRNGLTLDSTAAQLGLGRRIVAYYASGERSIPRVVALACRYLERGRDPSTPARAVASGSTMVDGVR